MILNRTYVYLIAGRDAEDREKFDNDLWAPPEGWEAAEANAWAALDELAEEG